MGYSEALLLGILQGIGEFLPISSSGHLVLMERGFGLTPSLTLNVFLHVGSLGAIICYYIKDVKKILVDSFNVVRGRLKGSERQEILKLIVATAITGVIGLLLEKPLGAIFSGPRGKFWLSGCFFVTALILASLFLIKNRKTALTLSWKGAMLIGLVQGFAVFPGISRSGSTIVAAMLLGLSGERAARFSFLLAIPIIGGAGLLEARHLGTISNGGPVLAGVLTSFAVGFACLWFLVKLINRGKMAWFSFYLVPLSVAVLIWGI
ncbi:undecaprenyl-diphosphate phosphatase [Myxococcota bacterium]|nr:undecaprenyl-diphosphate phosphatase [Myxococcota bacterium]MBU1537764.1 undecaprenyl-diphosphate phosphatase [Myxococcota bacterium]